MLERSPSLLIFENSVYIKEICVQKVLISVFKVFRTSRHLFQKKNWRQENPILAHDV